VPPGVPDAVIVVAGVGDEFVVLIINGAPGLDEDRAKPGPPRWVHQDDVTHWCGAGSGGRRSNELDVAEVGVVRSVGP
jgi:hypothetical protein